MLARFRNSPDDAFEINNPKYLCCCRQIHVATFAKPVAILSLLMYFMFNVIFLDNQYYLVLIPLLIGVFVYTTLLMGVWRRIRVMCLPYIIYQILYLLSILVLIVLIIVWLISPVSDCEPNNDSNVAGQVSDSTASAITSTSRRTTATPCQDNIPEERRLFVFMLVVAITSLCLHAYYLMVIVRFYGFLLDYEHHRRRIHGRRVHYLNGNGVFPASVFDPNPDLMGTLPAYPADDLPSVWIAPPAYDGNSMATKDLPPSIHFAPEGIGNGNETQPTNTNAPSPPHSQLP